MKKYYLLIFFVFYLSGCAALSSWTDAQARCAGDDKCLEQTKSYAKIGEAVASAFGPVAVGGASAVITYISLGVLGLKKKREDAKK